MDSVTWQQLIDKVWIQAPGQMERTPDYNAGVLHALFTLEKEMRVSRILRETETLPQLPGDVLLPGNFQV